ncbi:MAG: nucleoside-diphosphate-sugar epimerase [Sphingobacteriales bacterium]|jgi:nucleoside-diphosphate-sugar epimerase
MAQEKILVIGSSGQIGTDLILELQNAFGVDNVIASDIKAPVVQMAGPFEVLNALKKEKIEAVIKKHSITQIYLLAALLSATAEKVPQLGWDLNMNSLSHILDFAKEGVIKKIFFPSSIAVFGPTTPPVNTPQRTILEPSTVYGITKLAGERWAEYFFNKFQVDIRSIRYPGLISYKAQPGGGTTDYAVQIYHDALLTGHHDCFLKQGTILPMMYMPDAIRATMELMEAPSNKLTIRSSYNVAGFSFAPEDLAAEIQKYKPDFSISHNPDFRQQIAESWPQSIDDSVARADWGWKPEFDVTRMTESMLTNLKERLKE